MTTLNDIQTEEQLSAAYKNRLDCSAECGTRP